MTSWKESMFIVVMHVPWCLLSLFPMVHLNFEICLCLDNMLTGESWSDEIIIVLSEPVVFVYGTECKDVWCIYVYKHCILLMDVSFCQGYVILRHLWFCLEVYFIMHHPPQFLLVYSFYVCWINPLQPFPFGCVSLPMKLDLVTSSASLKFLIGELTSKYLGSGSILSHLLWEWLCWIFSIGFFVYLLFFSLIIYCRNLPNTGLNMLDSFLILMFKIYFLCKISSIMLA